MISETKHCSCGWRKTRKLALYTLTKAKEQEKMNKEHKQVYWDDDQKRFYWIEWIETGNNDIPVKHYIDVYEAWNKDV